VIADKVYPDERCVPSGGNADALERINRIRACHETINRRLRKLVSLGPLFDVIELCMQTFFMPL